MKNKIVSLFLVSVMLTNMAHASSVDISSMTIDELYELQQLLNDEIENREKKESTAEEKVDAGSSDNYVANYGSPIMAGYYIAGIDFLPGSYEITLSETDDYSTVATFVDQNSMSEYVSWSSSQRLKEVGKTAFIAKDNKTGHVHLDEGDVLYIAKGIGTITPAEEGSLTKGIYYIGKDIDPGSYVVTLTDIPYSGYLAIFENSEKLLNYTTWDSSEKLRENGKRAVIVKENKPYHIFLEEGDILYVTEGNGHIEKAKEDVFTAGIYSVGTDLEPGSYMGILSDFDYSSVVATFANGSDEITYASWDSANNLKEYSKAFIYADEDAPFHITLIDGDILYVDEGVGSLTKN